MNISEISIVVAVVFSLATKCILLTKLIPYGIRGTKAYRPWFFFVAMLTCALCTDMAWVAKLIRTFNPAILSYPALIFVIRASWGLLIAQYQCFALFIGHLIERHFKWRVQHAISTISSILLSSFFFLLAFFSTSLTGEPERLMALTMSTWSAPLEVNLIRFMPFYVVCVLLLPAFIRMCTKFRHEQLPRILRGQLRLLACYILLPYLLSELLFATDLLIRGGFCPHLIVSLSTIVLNGTITYCVFMLLRLRFLNLAEQVTHPVSRSILSEFRLSLEQLGNATSLQELSHITKTFFRDAFALPLSHISLHIRKHNTPNGGKRQIDDNDIEATVEHFLYIDNAPVCKTIRTARILPYDETVFDNFYEEDSCKTTLISFLDALSADIFIPVSTNNKIIGYIIIDRNARPQRCYGHIEHDEMLIFADYLANIINLIQNRNLDQIIRREHQTNNALYDSNRMIEQHRESLRTFLNKNRSTTIGVLIYRARQFQFINADARHVIDVDINKQSGHHLTQDIKQVTHLCTTYQSAQTIHSTNDAGENIIINAMPSLGHHGILITAHYPDIATIIASRRNMLDDNRTWDMPLYLETTRAGKLIDHFIPSSSETILNFKVALLKATLSQRALLIQAHEDDLECLITLIHHISGHTTLHIQDVDLVPNTFDTAIKLFGINPTLGLHSTEQPLLEKFNGGTIALKNTHYMRQETQEHLAEFIETGTFRMFKSDIRCTSNARLICSAPGNIEQQVREQQFCPHLYRALKDNIITAPTPASLNKEEFDALVNGMCQQIVSTHALRSLLKLTSRERDYLAKHHAKSFLRLKIHIQYLLTEKSKKHDIHDEVDFESNYNVTDPELVEAARLGRHALRDQKIVTMLWSKFQNQNKIATFLGVNRSSVSRRIKDYGLQ